MEWETTTIIIVWWQQSYNPKIHIINQKIDRQKQTNECCCCCIKYYATKHNIYITHRQHMCTYGSLITCSACLMTISFVDQQTDRRRRRRLLSCCRHRSGCPALALNVCFNENLSPAYRDLSSDHFPISMNFFSSTEQT